MHRLGIIFGLMAALVQSGCAFGPQALERSYGPYYESLRHADEEELLRNLVHLRYHEVPGSMSVASIDAQFELTGTAEARPFFVSPNPSNSNVIFKTFTAILPDALVSGANRPTIAFSPGDDSETIRRFLTPMTAEYLTFLVQTSWPVATITQLWAERLNGVPNQVAADNSTVPDPAPYRFPRIVQLLQIASDRELMSVHMVENLSEVSGPLSDSQATAAAAVEAAKQGLELRRGADGKSWSLVRREKRLVIEVTPGAERDGELLELESLLNLVPARAQYNLVVIAGRIPDPLVHPTPPGTELRINPRSTARVFQYLASGVQAPEDHVACGIASSNENRENSAGASALLTIHTAKGHAPPPCAYASIPYRGWWYYIDDRDIQSKATFAIMMQLSRLDLRRRPPGNAAPVLTLPTGR